MYSVYGLCNPLDGSFWYIGITTDVYRRMREHMSCEGENAEKNAIVQTLQRLQIVFYMVVLEQVDTYQEALEREIYWIRVYMEQEDGLTNISGTSYSPADEVYNIHKPVSSPGRWGRTRETVHAEVLLYYYLHGRFPEGYKKSLRSYYKVRYLQEDSPDHSYYLHVCNQYEQGIAQEISVPDS